MYNNDLCVNTDSFLFIDNHYFETYLNTSSFVFFNFKQYNFKVSRNKKKISKF